MSLKTFVEYHEFQNLQPHFPPSLTIFLTYWSMVADDSPSKESILHYLLLTPIFLTTSTWITSHYYIAQQQLMFITALYILNNCIIYQMWASKPCVFLAKECKNILQGEINFITSHFHSELIIIFILK